MCAKRPWLIACVLLLAAVSACAGEASVQRVALHSLAGACHASVQLRLAPAPALIAALEQGVELTLRYEFDAGNGWRGSDETRRLRIGFQPLTRHYLLHPESSDSGMAERAFSRRGALLAALEDVPRLRLSPEFCAAGREGFRFRARLDAGELPAPLRLTTAFDDDWSLDTGWTAWPAAD